MNCPKCTTSALETVSVNYEDRSVPGPKPSPRVLQVDRCGACGGVWFDRDELDTYLNAKPKGLEAPKLAAEKAAELDAKRGECPRCAVALDARPARSNPHITVDACAKCDGVWVDGAELSDAGGEGLPFNERLKAMFGDIKPRNQ
jgi:Zn-finger nucleic acid-binding protein